MQSIVNFLKKFGLLSAPEDYSVSEESIHKQKTKVLTNQISFLIVAICIAFIFFDYFNNIRNTLIFYVILAGIALSAYSMNLRNKTALAKHIILISSILTTFFFSLRVSQEAFVSLMYFPIIIGAYALFDYKQIWIGTIYFFICMGFYIIDMYGNIEVSYLQELTPEMVQKNRIINYIVILVSSVFLILFILSVNYRTEEMIKKQNAELIKTNDEMDKFVYSTSHDLRAPLMSVLGLVNIAAKEDDTAMIKECLKMMEDRIHSLDNFITEIMDISRNKKSAIEIAPFNVKSSIDNILDDFRYMDEFEKIKFDLDIEDQCILHSDQTRFNLIMRNLISNAIKYHNFNIEDPQIKVVCVPEESTIRLMVSDNGYGIPEEHQPKLFDMFFRGTQNGKGTGLGLYIVQETALKLNGKISLESVEGKGSTFELEIPNINGN